MTGDGSSQGKPRAYRAHAVRNRIPFFYYFAVTLSPKESLEFFDLKVQSDYVDYDSLHFHKNSDVYASLFFDEFLQKSFAGILQQFYHQLKVTLSTIIRIRNGWLRRMISQIVSHQPNLHLVFR